MVRAATGQAGRKRQIIRAVRPELVAARMALASRSLAVRQQVWVMASLILGGDHTALFKLPPVVNGLLRLLHDAHHGGQCLQGILARKRSRRRA